jgi:ABC-type multidrug transport system permease subunit
LVRRSHFLTIIAAWVITVPAAATISALIFWVIASYTGGGQLTGQLIDQSSHWFLASRETVFSARFN